MVRRNYFESLTKHCILHIIAYLTLQSHSWEKCDASAAADSLKLKAADRAAALWTVLLHTADHISLISFNIVIKLGLDVLWLTSWCYTNVYLKGLGDIEESPFTSGDQKGSSKTSLQMCICVRPRKKRNHFFVEVIHRASASPQHVKDCRCITFLQTYIHTD